MKAKSILLIFSVIFLMGIGINSQAAMPKPDLIVKNVYLKQHAYGNKCRIMITVQNIGDRGANISANEFNQSVVELLKGNSIWGGYALTAVDPHGILKPSGRTLTFPWNAILLKPGTYYVGAIIDANNKISEKNENNNKLTPKKLVCGGSKLPDLTVKNIQLTKGCKMRVTIANIGKGTLPDSAYDMHNGAAIQMYNNNKPWGGIRLGAVDSQKKLAKPGKTLSFMWFPGANNLTLKPGKNNIKLTIDNNHVVKESNERNNTKSKTLKCGKLIHLALPDLTITSISLNKSCHVQVTVKNAGKARIPNSVWSVHSPKSAGVYLYRNGKKWGGASIWKFDHAKHLQKSGGVAVYTSSLKVGLKTKITAVVDLWNKVKESNERNNTKSKTLKCAKASPSKLPDLGLYGFVKIGKNKTQVEWNRTITLTPSDATLISNGKPAFNIYYNYREYNGGAASGFKNEISFNSKVVSIQTNLSVKPKQIKYVATQAYFGTQSGKLCFKIDAGNNIKEKRENNNEACVNVKFSGFSQQGGAIHNTYKKIQNTIKNPGTVPKKQPNFVLPGDKVK